MTLRPVGRLGLRLSVVVTTYESPRALALVLAGLFRQSVRHFELLIADDGSGPETAALIAEGDYLVFFDGDRIAGRECLAIHLDAARGQLPGRGKIPLAQRLADRLTVTDVRRGLLDGVGTWWLDVGKRRRLATSRVPWLGRWMNRRVPREPSWRGENSSAFAVHLRAVGEFDERFTYGFEDADLGHRLQAHGIHGRSVRYTAPVFHLEHPRPYSRPEEFAANRALYDENRARRATRIAHGLQAP